ncbi:MAG: sigma-70 family RNA polymerase sigma factor [Acidobacteria bacterium]|nr:sigma-70 family RNA polymerase sigma factor [Acidobacteriota bacterium]
MAIAGSTIERLSNMAFGRQSEPGKGRSGGGREVSARAKGRVRSVAEEEALIRQAQAGNRMAFEELIRCYDQDVLRLAMNLMKRPEDARDIYQEAFLKIYKNLDRFRFECSFYTWIYRIVTNVCLDQMRRRNTRKEDQAPVSESSDGGDSSREATAGGFFERQPELRAEANPEKRLMGKEIGRKIATALAQLSPRERMVFEMKHYHGLKLRAIGEVLGTSEETVKNSLFRATQKLRGELAGLL